jgi:hypothetical protein
MCTQQWATELRYFLLKRSTGSRNQKREILGTNARAKYKPKTQTGQVIV